MIIQKEIVSGGNTVQVNKISGAKKSDRGGAKGDPSITEDNRLNKRMEFMYCIPDLEVFIDKTIKKCLLEYDLDANDTEAVLDDMEKAWPKSPPRPSEKQVLRDCNDNSQNGKSYRQDELANQAQDNALLGGAISKYALKDGDSLVNYSNLKDKSSQNITDNFYSKKEEPLDPAYNGKKELLEHAGFEGDRSDTSSPDVIDGQSQARKHPKLKSLLQQRYFGGQDSSSCDTGQPGKKEEEKLNQTWSANKQLASNLDLLASAADIHPVSAREAKEHRIEAIRHLQEESEKRFQAVKQFPSTSLQESVATTSESSGWMPVLLKLMSSPSSSSSPMHEFNNHDNDAISGHHGDSHRMVSPETSQRSSPNRSTTNDNSHLVTNSRPQMTNSTSFLRMDKTQLFQAHQNGYHAHTPQETGLIRRDIMSSNQGKITQVSSTVTHTSLSRDASVDLTPATPQYNGFIIPPHSQLHQLNHPDQHYSESFYEPHRYRGSRIANIIAEELQKDDDDQVQEQQTYLSASRTSHVGLKPSDINEPARTRSFSLPATYRRAPLIKPTSYLSHDSSAHTPMNPNYKTVTRIEQHPTSTQPRTVIHILPAHYSMTSTHPGPAILSSHLGQTASIGNRASRCFNDDEDQPQDLSTKPRRFAEENHERQYQFSSNQATPTTGSGHVLYFSNPIPHLTTQSRSRHNDSTSPCSLSDQECGYKSRSDNGSAQIKTYEVERKGYQGFDVNSTEIKDSKTLAGNKRQNLTNISSETRDSETNKRRKFE